MGGTLGSGSKGLEGYPKKGLEGWKGDLEMHVWVAKNNHWPKVEVGE
jgi:hypothetical protein